MKKFWCRSYREYIFHVKKFSRQNWSPGLPIYRQMNFLKALLLSLIFDLFPYVERSSAFSINYVLTFVLSLSLFINIYWDWVCQAASSFFKVWNFFAIRFLFFSQGWGKNGDLMKFYTFTIFTYDLFFRLLFYSLSLKTFLWQYHVFPSRNFFKFF